MYVCVCVINESLGFKLKLSYTTKKYRKKKRKEKEIEYILNKFNFDLQVKKKCIALNRKKKISKSIVISKCVSCCQTIIFRQRRIHHHHHHHILKIKTKTSI